MLCILPLEGVDLVLEFLNLLIGRVVEVRFERLNVLLLLGDLHLAREQRRFQLAHLGLQCVLATLENVLFRRGEGELVLRIVLEGEEARERLGTGIETVVTGAGAGGVAQHLVHDVHLAVSGGEAVFLSFQETLAFAVAA